MARVEFVSDYDYQPSAAPRSLIAYKAGYIGTVRRECCDRAVAAGKAVELPQEGKSIDDEALPKPDRHRARKTKP